ncbi:MAG: cyclic nucleotide-binding domain-containing protein [Proteobacteria bacterium]|nr:cyclic nucleotide-binding domain-containing protein [Pseudomonadota bacterium]
MITIESISEYDIFTGLSSKDLESIQRIMKAKRFEANDIILKESNISSDLFILKSGRVSIELDTSSYNEAGSEQIVILRPGDIFGEIAFLENKRRSAHVIALDTVEAYQMDGNQLKDLFAENYKIGYVIMKNIAITLSRRLIDTNFKWRNGIRSNPPY